MGNEISLSLSNGIQEYLKHANKLKSKTKFIISPASTYAQPIDNFQERILNVKSRMDQVRNRHSIDREDIFESLMGCRLYKIIPHECYYLGQWKNGLPHGYGACIYPDLSCYEGEFHEGEVQTQNDDGLLMINNDEDPKQCTYYCGMFKKSRFHGKGIMSHKNMIYNGEWENGLQSGIGVQSYSKIQSLSKGQFQNGVKQREGNYQIHENNQFYTYEGSFKNGLFHGLGKMEFNRKKFFQGEFAFGLRQGPGELFGEIGEYRGFFFCNKIDGYGCYRCQNDRLLSRGIFKEQQYNGKTRLFLDNELLVEDSFIEFPNPQTLESSRQLTHEGQLKKTLSSLKLTIN